MHDQQALALVRGIHTTIYLVMALSIFVVLYAGVTGYSGIVLWMALVLLGIEAVVFVSSGMKCPLTDMAVKYGAKKGHVFDTFLPEHLTRYTFRFFVTIMTIGLILLGARWLGILS
jgi:nitrate reductase NapE component